MDMKEIFEAYQDEDRWILKEPNEIAIDFEECSEKRIDLLSNLWGYYNLQDKEFDDKNERYRFI